MVTLHSLNKCIRTHSYLPGLEGVRIEKTASFFNYFPEDNSMITDTYNKVFTMGQAPFSCFPCMNSFHPYDNSLRCYRCPFHRP